jgi:hypothetical protein
MNKPWSPASERNRNPILAVLRERFADRKRVLEIGSGTGQHAAHFAAALPFLQWQASDLPENLPGIRLWLDEAGLQNTPPPLALDVQAGPPPGEYDAVFTANTLHIMSWPKVVRMFEWLPSATSSDAVLVVYGPFNDHGRFTSESNAAFDASLREGLSSRGIRDFEAVDALARKAGFELLEDREMPANNRCLCWRRA